jgi:molecular chaperone HtpG
MKQIKSDQECLEQLVKDKKNDELTQEEKDKREELTKLLDEKTAERDAALQAFAGEQPVVSQLIDLALLATNKLTGESLDRFVKRSVSLLGKQ